MGDLINRQDVIKAVLLSNFSACTMYGRSEEGMATAKELVQAIKNLPSALPERKKGKWEIIFAADEFGEPYPCGCICSECGFQNVVEDNYCPNC